MRIITRISNIGLLTCLLQFIVFVSVVFSTPDNDLITASETGNIKAALKAIEEKANLNALSSHGRSALTISIIKKHTDIAKLLINKGADINLVDYDQLTPLCYAAERGDLCLVKQLIDKGANVNHQNDQGTTPLLFAVLDKDSYETAKLLIDNGANVNLNDNNGYSPIIAAAYNGNFRIVKYLTKKGADLNAVYKKGGSALNFAVINGDFQIVKFLVKNGASVNPAQEVMQYVTATPLMWAVAHQHPNIVKYLLDKGAEIYWKNKDNESVLTWAKKINNKEINNILQSAIRKYRNK